MSGDTKNQHYIPQFYLKRFTDENDRFCVYDIKSKKLLTRQRPRNFAAARYFYDTEVEILNKVLEETFMVRPELKNEIDISDPQFVEHYFSRSESDAKNVIEKIDSNNEELWNEENQQKLIIFLHDLCARTEFVRKRFEYFNETLNKHIDKMNFPNKEKHKKYDDKETQFHQIFSISQLLQTASMLIERYDWFIGYNKSNINFIVGDNPAADIFTGFNDICFPISQRKAIVFRNKNHNGYLISDDESADGKSIDLSLRSILGYNAVQIAHSYRYYFGDKATFITLDKINKIAGVNPISNWNF